MAKITRAVMAAFAIRRKELVYRWYLYHNI
jgi:hypothetical protein